jgi:hypothetical protein
MKFIDWKSIFLSQASYNFHIWKPEPATYVELHFVFLCFVVFLPQISSVREIIVLMLWEKYCYQAQRNLSAMGVNPYMDILIYLL